ncbi:hypothetical protein PQ743_05735 [Thermoanaerobacterium thermosaccharolyticum]|uniref:hypothetical protein n=1 Tax=Thermoanaerobacterium thermosaccharolyticum TaxID=1517 RepID=UPI003DA94A7D
MSRKKEYEEYKKKYLEFQNTFKQMYYDKIKGLINEEQFKMLSDELQSEMKIYHEKLNKIEGQLNSNDVKAILIQQAYDKIKNIIDMQDLNRQMIENLIDFVEIFKDNRIKIHYKFSNLKNFS